jgi:dipeptidyl aminopeptidase/acylaminoacyl peptidase
LGPDGKNADIWIFGDEGPPVAFEANTGYSAGSPVWSPDGSRIAFWETHSGGGRDIFVKAVKGNGRAELLYKSATAAYPTDWARDGRSLVFGEYTPDTKSDIWTLNLADKRANAILNTVHSEGYAALSPDGKWLAYQSDDSGRNEIFVQPWEGGSSGTKRLWKVSSDGGGLPRWRSNGAELFYINGSGGMMSVPLHPSGDDFRFDPPQQLFQTRPVQKFWNLFDVTPDGQRFLMNLPLEWSNSSLITVMTNWTEKLKS